MFFHPKSTKNKCMQINNHSIQYLENLFQIKVFMREALTNSELLFVTNNFEGNIITHSQTTKLKAQV